jgi:hypothetical protein
MYLYLYFTCLLNRPKANYKIRTSKDGNKQRHINKDKTKKQSKLDNRKFDDYHHRLYESVPIQELTTSLCNLPALVHPEDGGDTIL